MASSNCKNIFSIPFMLQSDGKFSSLKSTRIFNHLVSCFVIGGECRLCFPQMLGLVLPNFSGRQIDEMCIRLRITNMQANKEQLQILKLAGALPSSEVNCELITKSNAERLAAQFLIENNILLDEARKNENFIQISHDCFGGCVGRIYKNLAPNACIECIYCHFLFKPENFCRHSHIDNILSSGVLANNFTLYDCKCYWGFDSLNWAFYIHIDDEYIKNKENYNKINEEYLQFISFYQAFQ